MEQKSISLTEDQWQRVMGILFAHADEYSTDDDIIAESIHVQLWGQHSNFLPRSAAERAHNAGEIIFPE